MLWSCLVQGALLLTLVSLFYLGARSLVRQQAERELVHLAEQTARSLGNTLRSAEISAEMLLAPLRDQHFDTAQLHSLLQAAVTADPNVDGARVFIEPGRLPGVPAGYDCHAQLRLGVVERRCKGDITNEEATRQLRVHSPMWTAPYANADAGGGLFITHTIPLHATGHTLPAGVVSVDVPLQRLRLDLGRLPGTVGLRATLLAPDQRVVLSSTEGVHAGLPIRDYLRLRPDLAPLLGHGSTTAGTELDHRSSEGVRFLTRVAALEQPGWRLVLSADHDLLLADLRTVTWGTVALGVMGLLLWLVLVRRHAQHLLQPMEALTAAARRFDAGHFEQPLAADEQDDEVGQVSRAFEHARRSIVQQMATIAELASARERNQSELRIAHGIQQGMLAEPPQLSGGGYQLRTRALLVPAREVGGDFQHVACIAPTRLCFVIGDVSGNGVPAALFMARVLTILEAAMHLHQHPDRILADAARTLADRNESCMFATVLCGVVDVATGMYELASAGHESPLRRQANGRVRVLPVRSGAALGIPTGYGFPLSHGVLADGEYLLAYTDGITEAQCPQQTWFGLDGLRAAVAAVADDRLVCAHTVRALEGFTGSEHAHDDMALVVIGRHVMPSPVTLQAPATLGGLQRLLACLEDGLRTRGVDGEQVHRAQLVVDELCGNVIAHQRDLTHVTLDVVATPTDDGLVLDVRDGGEAFDPTRVPAPDLDAPLADRPIGGLGLHLVRSMSSRFQYRRREGVNHIHLVLLPAGPSKE